MIVSHASKHEYQTFWITALIGARVRLVESGCPYNGVIVQIDHYGKTIVALDDDGRFVRKDIDKLERVSEIKELLSPYREELTSR